MRRVCLLAVLAVLGVAPTASAAPLFTITSNTSGVILANPPFTLGFAFTVNTPQYLTALGVFDSGQNGLAENHPVGLWNSAGVLLASTTVTSANPLTNQFRYAPISPVLLQAGQSYQIGALYTNVPAADPLFFPGGATGFATDPAITFNSARFAFGGTLANPTGNSGTAPGFFGPNAIIVPTPEPVTLAVFGGLALAGLGVARRRRA